jgi:serine/threonine protein kinase/formylglycine-generating enzyme required for sulfatase activity
MRPRQAQSDCPDDNVLSAFVERTLDAAGMQVVEEHLDDCKVCLEFIAAYAQAYLVTHDEKHHPEATTRPDRERVAQAFGSHSDPDRAPDLAPGTFIGEYRLERLLGQGGMGRVWLARDTVLERDVAIKVGEIASEELCLRARVEARAIARLAHPNIVRVHHAGEFLGRPLLVTEVLSGKSLDWIEKPTTARRVAAIGCDLARALAAAHAAGVLHRDIKPANAFVCDDGVVKLLDFGLAQLHDPPPEARRGMSSLSDSEAAELVAPTPTPSSDDVMAGTPLYMAPETWRCEPATERTDVYSLGAVLYEFLTGMTPYAGTSPRRLRTAVLEGRLDVQALASSAPEGLASLVGRCLSLEPAKRPSAAELCEKLEAASSPLRSGPEEPIVLGRNPYRGLLPFGPEHRAQFFGRSRETAAVLDALHASPLVLVVGVSGAGKSSIVTAGVWPKVRAGSLGGGDWKLCAMVPGQDPLSRLGHALVAILAARGIAAEPEDAVQVFTSDPATRTDRLLVVIDQLEEAFTQADAGARSAFFAAVATLCSAGPRLRVIATLRADFLGRLGDLPKMRLPLIFVGPLSRGGLREAILGPARSQGITMEPALVDSLVTMLRDGSLDDRRERRSGGVLPLLEFALEALWDRRDPTSQRIGLADLEALGGLSGALGSHADATLMRMSPARRKEAKRILLSLVTAQRTRKRQEERALSLDGKEARGALMALVDARLVVASVGEEGTAYEIVHEVLTTGWPTLRGWLDEESLAREAYDRLVRSALEWDRLGRGKEGLLGERQLVELHALGTPELPALERAFVTTSRQAISRSRRRSSALRLGLLLAIVLTASVAWGASMERQHARMTRLLDEARGLDAHAEEMGRDAADLRGRALALFDEDDPGPAEDLWKEMFAREDEVDQKRRAVGSILDRALGLEPDDALARSLYADVTFARVLAAERLHDHALLAQLRARLGALDDGSRASRLSAPARVRVDTDPPGASLVLSRYENDEAGHRVTGHDRPLETGVVHELAPGSYVTVATLAGRYETRLPVLLDPGEERTLRISLPRSEYVPSGMIYIPAGRFLYGSGDDEATRRFLEHQPQHALETRAFLIGREEVQWKDYIAYVRSLPPEERKAHSPLFSFDASGRAVFTAGDQTLVEGQSSCPDRPCRDGRLLPVENVSRAEAEAYAAWLGRSNAPKGARLCTDREWERAARGADDRPYPWGSAEPTTEDACSTLSAKDIATAVPCEPGSHPKGRSPFGVDDMAGNVWEWVSGGADARKPIAIYRGGGYACDPFHLASTNRGTALPGAVVSGSGIRICASLE